MSDWESAETMPEREAKAPGAHLVLLVISDEQVETHPLPSRGRLTIGRASDADIRIADSLASRVHAALHAGEDLSVEDLDSANGTRVAGVRLAAGERRGITPGTAFEIGATMFVCQVRGAPPATRRLATHGRLEAKLDEECARRAHTHRAPLALLRVVVDGLVARGELERALTADLGPGDLVAWYAPGQLELLLVEAARSRAEQVAAVVKARLEHADREVQVAVAVFPTDGTSAEALIACTAEAIGGRAPLEAAPIVAAPAMVELHRVVERVASGVISVLLLGETGVGKELIAEAVHTRSPRRGRPLVRINCAALSDSLLEAELFGYEKGAFTGADRAKPGLLEAASGGTIFLDEVGELPASAQAKLLRALEQREVLRVGSLEPRSIDVRIISATNRNLEGEAREGRFRRDLYFRLNGVSLEVPPLRARREEIEPLAEMFLQRASRQLGIDPPALAPATLDLLRGYDWPGNVRELRNVIDRAVLLSTQDTIEPVHLPFEKLATRWASELDGELAPEEDELRQRILAALERAAGNQTRAADSLGFSRQTLSKWLDRFGIRRPRKRG